MWPCQLILIKRPSLSDARDHPHCFKHRTPLFQITKIVRYIRDHPHYFRRKGPSALFQKKGIIEIVSNTPGTIHIFFRHAGTIQIVSDLRDLPGIMQLFETPGTIHLVSYVRDHRHYFRHQGLSTLIQTPAHIQGEPDARNHPYCFRRQGPSTLYQTTRAIHIVSDAKHYSHSQYKGLSKLVETPGIITIVSTFWDRPHCSRPHSLFQTPGTIHEWVKDWLVVTFIFVVVRRY